MKKIYLFLSLLFACLLLGGWSYNSGFQSNDNITSGGGSFTNGSDITVGNFTANGNIETNSTGVPGEVDWYNAAGTFYVGLVAPTLLANYTLSLPLADGESGQILATSGGGALIFANPSGYSKTVYATGTAYTLTNATAAVNFGTIDPTITIDKAGTYLVFAKAKLTYENATYDSVQTVTTYLYRTNNNPATLPSTSTTFTMGIISAANHTIDMVIPPTIYTTALTSDVLSLYSSVSAVPTSGNVTINGADIEAVRLY